jgi:hypothetical protein
LQPLLHGGVVKYVAVLVDSNSSHVCQRLAMLTVIAVSENLFVKAVRLTLEAQKATIFSRVIHLHPIATLSQRSANYPRC